MKILPSQYDALTPAQAIAMQKQMRENVNIEPLAQPVELIGGADISFNRHEEIVYAGIIVLTYPRMKPIAQTTIIAQTKFPYISGLLAFREIPALLQAWDKLQIKPDVMVLDGQGIAHERRIGIATHFGLLTGAPSIGCAKTKLTGSYEMPENAVFAETPLMHKQERVGTVLRTKLHCKPVFISPGHKVNIAQSISIIKSCVTKYRIPEPTRLAHLLVNEARLAASKKSVQKFF